MNLITGFLRFWYDFIIGDAWEIALGVVAVVGAGAALLRTASVPPEFVPPGVAVGIVIVGGVSLRMEVRRRTKRAASPNAGP